MKPGTVRPDITLVHFQPPGPVVSPPLGCLCLMSALQAKGLTSELRDCQLENSPQLLDIEQMARFVLDESADIIGFSAMGNVLPHLVLLLREMKRRCPDKRIVLGGAGPSSVGVSLLRSYPLADVMVIGEGEDTLPSVVQALKAKDVASLTNLRGLVVRTPDGAVETGSKQRLKDIDSLPLPGYHLVDLSRYNGPIPLELVRGCPFACAFCESSALWGRRALAFSPERTLHIAREVSAVSATAGLGFVDDSFGVNRLLARRLMDGLEKFDITWHCSTRLEFIDEDWVSLLRGAGCTKVFVGIESGSDSVLRSIGKRGVPVKDVPARVELLKSGIDMVTTSFVWGFPFESLQDLMDTLSLIAVLLKNGAVTPLHLLSALPRSPLTRVHGDLRKFDPNLLPDISAAPMSQEIVSLIEESRDVFSSFYYFDHPTFPLKLKAVRHFLRRRAKRTA